MINYILISFETAILLIIFIFLQYKMENTMVVPDLFITNIVSCARI